MSSRRRPIRTRLGEVLTGFHLLDWRDLDPMQARRIDRLPPLTLPVHSQFRPDLFRR